MKNKTRRQSGFSLSEVLCVAAIIGLLCAISIPAFNSYRKTVRVKTMDDVAKELFLTVQNNLTSQKEAGNLSAVYDALTTKATKYDTNNVNSNGNNSALSEYVDKGFYYVTSPISDESIAVLFGGRLSLETIANGKNYIIFVNPSTATVKSVFCCDEVLEIANIEDLKSFARDARKTLNPVIGYYGGGDSSDPQSVTSGASVSANIENSDELILRIKGKIPSDDFNQSDATITIVFSDEHGNQQTVTITNSQIVVEYFDEHGTKQTVTTNTSTAISWKSSTEFEIAYVMDSTESGKGFEDLFPGLTLGDNIIADVQLSCDNGKDPVVTADDQAIGNSQFAYCTKDETTNTENIGITNPRHLSNLDDGYQPDSDTTNININQLEDMDFDKKDSDGNRIYPTSFDPIDTSNLETSGAAITYDGGGHSMDNFKIDTTSNAGITTDAGIFASPDGWTFTDITINNPDVSGNGNAGTLVGSAEKCIFENIVVTDPQVNGKDSAGGLAGELNGSTITNCGVHDGASDDAGDNTITSADGPAGGLVGQTSGTAISMSYAAVDTITASGSNGWVGGLIGESNGGSVSQCYADTICLASKDNADGNGPGAGGLIGHMDGTTASNCYAVTEYFNSSSTAAINAGFSASITTDITTGAISNSYALTGSVKTCSNGAICYGFTPASSVVDTTTCTYYASSNFGNSDGVLDALDEGSIKKSEASTSMGAIASKYTGSDEWAVKASENTNPYTAYDGDDPDAPYNYMYDDSTTHAAYSYPAIGIKGLDHYGNWPEEEKITNYTLSYNLNVSGLSPIPDATTPEAVTTSAGAVVSLAAVTYSSEKYLFAGWDDDPNGTGKYSAGADYTIDRDITLYAIWSEVYTLSYDFNLSSYTPSPDVGTTSTPVAVTTSAVTTVAITTSKPIDYSGQYSFVGWDEDPKGTGTYSAGKDYTIDSTTTLYAIWKLNIYSITFSKNPEVTSGAITNMPSNITGLTAGSTVDFTSLKKPQRSPFTFLGWSEDSTATKASINCDEKAFPVYRDYVLYPVWQFLPNTVTLNVTVDGEATSLEDLSISIHLDGDTTSYGFTYKSAGVYETRADNGTYSIYYNGVDTGKNIVINGHNATASIQLYTITVTYRKDSGTVAWSDSLSEKYSLKNITNSDYEMTVSNGGITVSAIGTYTSRPVYAGTDWNIAITEQGVDSFYTSKTVNEHILIYIDYFTLSYNGNAPASSSVNSVPAYSSLYRKNTYALVTELRPTCDKGNTFFSVWNTKADGKGESYESSTKSNRVYIQLTGTTVLYAQWSDYLTVTYKSNTTETLTNTEGDIFSSGNSYDQDTKILPGSTIILCDTDAVRKGYTFVGWNTASNGRGTNYEPGARVVVTQNLTLYAQWAYEGTYTIVYYGNGGQSVTGTTENKTFHEVQSQVTFSLNGYTRPKYTFLGWSTSSTTSDTDFVLGSNSYIKSGSDYYFADGVTMDCSIMRTADSSDGEADHVIKLYAVWTSQKTFSVTFKLEKMTYGTSNLTCTLGREYTAHLTYEKGFNPPAGAEDIIVYVDNDGNGEFGEGEKLIAITDYKWDSYTLELTIPGERVTGDIIIIAAATAGQHTISYYDYNYKTEYDTTPESRKTWGINSEDTYSVHTFYTPKTLTPSTSEYIFVGWNSEKDGSGDWYYDSSNYEVLGNLRLYAQWNKTTLVGAVIYNSYECTVNDDDNNRTSARYFLAEGEIQAMSNGQTISIIDNGGQPHSSSSYNSQTSNITGGYFYYGILVPSGSKISDYTIEYTTNGSSWTKLSTNSATKEISSASKSVNTLYKIDTTNEDQLGYAFSYNKGTKGGSDWYGRRFEYALSDYDYYVFVEKPSNNFKADVKQIRVQYDSHTVYFSFENGSRPTSGSAGYAYSASEANLSGWSNWTGNTNTQQYPKINIHNGNVPTLSRSFANFFLKSGCQADFTVYNYDNGYQLASINLRDSAGVARSTTNNLFTKMTDSAGNTYYRFNKAAMAELDAGEYTVYFDYISKDGKSDYVDDPSFVLTVYNSNISGYRYVLFDIQALVGSDSSKNVQLADIAFYSDATMMDEYKFADSARLYKVTSSRSYTESENEALLIDNNSKTKYCASTSNGKDRILIDTGDGYQFSPNLYGYLTYVNAADINEWASRQPSQFQYYGSNNSNVLTSAQTPTTAGVKLESSWIALTGSIKVGTYEVYSSSERYYVPTTSGTKYNLNKMDEAAIRQTNGDPLIATKYALTYDINCTTVSAWKYEKNKNYDGTSGNYAKTYGDVIIGFGVPQYDGYYFLGWSEDKNATEADYTPGSHYKLIYNTTMYAVWSDTEPTFSLNYNRNLSSGTSESVVTAFPKNTVGFGYTSISAITPLRTDGLIFDSWSWLVARQNDGELNDSPYNDGTTSNQYKPGATIYLGQNAVLYANWVKAYKITIPESGNGFITSGSDSIPETSNTYTFTVNVEPGYGEPSVSVSGKGSVAVSKTSSSGIAYEGVIYSYEIKNISSDVSVYITPHPQTFDITFVNDSVDTSKYKFTIKDAKGNDITSSGTSCEYGRSCIFTIIPIPENNSGLIVTGADWYQYMADGSVKYAVVDVKADTEVHIVVTGNKYTVSFDLNGGAGSTPSAMTCYENIAYAMPNPGAAPTGKVFTGWSSDVNASYGTYSAGDLVAFEQNTTLYAIWRNQYTVTFKNRTGSVISTVVVADGRAVSAPTADDLTSSGYDFIGWYNEETSKLAILDAVISDMTVYAKYDPITYNISYDANGGTMPAETYSTAYNVECDTTLPKPEKTGYTFSGWKEKNSTSTSTYSAISKGTTGDKNLIATWTAKNYKVILHSNYGVDSTYDANVDYNSTKINVSGHGFSKGSEYTIKGWYTQKDGGTRIADSDGTLVVDTTKYTDDGHWTTTSGGVALYAHWIAKTTINVKLDGNPWNGVNVTISGNSKTTNSSGQSVFELSDSADGYKVYVNNVYSGNVTPGAVKNIEFYEATVDVKTVDVNGTTESAVAYADPVISLDGGPAAVHTDGSNVWTFYLLDGTTYNVLSEFANTSSNVGAVDNTNKAFTVYYYYVSVNTYMNGNPSTMSAISLNGGLYVTSKNGITDNDGAWEFIVADESKKYKVWANGVETSVVNTSNNLVQTGVYGKQAVRIDYYTIHVDVKFDSDPDSTHAITMTGGTYSVISESNIGSSIDFLVMGNSTDYTVLSDDVVCPELTAVRGRDSVTVNYYTVSYSNNGSEHPASQVVLSGSVITIPEAGSWARHNFAGWSVGSSSPFAVGAYYTVTGRTEFVAKWNAYTGHIILTASSIGYTGNFEVTDGATVTTPSAYTAPTRNHCTLVGWATTDSSKTIVLNADFTVNTSNGIVGSTKYDIAYDGSTLTLQAVWSYSETYYQWQQSSGLNEGETYLIVSNTKGEGYAAYTVDAADLYGYDVLSTKVNITRSYTNVLGESINYVIADADSINNTALWKASESYLINAAGKGRLANVQIFSAATIRSRTESNNWRKWTYSGNTLKSDKNFYLYFSGSSVNASSKSGNAYLYKKINLSGTIYD